MTIAKSSKSSKPHKKSKSSKAKKLFEPTKPINPQKCRYLFEKFSQLLKHNQENPIKYGPSAAFVKRVTTPRWKLPQATKLSDLMDWDPKDYKPPPPLDEDPDFAPRHTGGFNNEKIKPIEEDTGVTNEESSSDLENSNCNAEKHIPIMFDKASSTMDIESDKTEEA
ncbi:uncharacterized protein KGF55_000155 [Candida pseudojiufengensis]|uniref:uncharacterized protein n=1 Tax=Candida pseudojiufengensis TaxID=497109 RepID=UPI0022251876|nr:uncharacterized protein KGF55_000155 [Candida pseudojiufengensis]KAI5966746.1 hypothetical protein KGF55_000155 [Candida pseudojiufengensis]